MAESTKTVTSPIGAKLSPDTQSTISQHDRKIVETEISPVERALVQGNTEHQVALAFADRYRGSLIYDHNTNNWLRWTGQYWAVEKTGLVSHYCRVIASEANEKISQRSSFARGVEAFCKNDPIFATTSNKFDRDNYLFNTPLGTINLLTGELLKHAPSDLITNIAGCSPIEGYGERFPQFLDEITCGDYELQKFLQMALGSCLSGALEEHWLMFWIGSGRNGKNTLGDAVMRVMGSYARKIPSGTLMKSKHEGHPTEIANLKGCRLAVASEVDASAFWSEARINELTGDAKLAARYMGGNFFEFDRTFKLLVYGNHRPRLNSVTQAMQNRLKMVRFNANFAGKEAKPDPDLPAKLKSEDGHILTWLIDGHLLWVANSKKLPHVKAVEAELQDYVECQATPENWMDECLVMSEGIWMPSRDLFSAYTAWKSRRNEHPVSNVVWGEAMAKRFQKKKTNRGMFYQATFTPDLVDESVHSAG
jgi:putative DNA primase/helicase